MVANVYRFICLRKILPSFWEKTHNLKWLRIVKNNEMGQDSSDFRLEECYNLPMPRPQRFLFIWWSTPRASEVLKASGWSQCAARVWGLLVKANANHKKRSFNTNIRSLDVIISHQTLDDSFFFSTRVLWTATKRRFLLHLERDGADKLTLIEQKCGPVKLSFLSQGIIQTCYNEGRKRECALSNKGLISLTPEN